MRCASLCIGIVDYAHPAYGSSSRRLRFATTDARAFSDYLKSAFTGHITDRDHKLLLDQEAILPNAERAIAEIAEAIRLDLFVLYLGGHGEQGDSKGGWFCLADASPSARSLDGAKLEHLLNGVRAHRVLVVVDCCHAEAVVGGTRYFTTLEDGRARLFVASARRDQLAWEDAKLQRSVLSDVLLRACSTASPIQSNLGTINIEAALFPYLREQVPLLAAAQKQGSVQEPVTGGTAHSDIELPVVSSKSFGRQLTIAQTVRARLREILGKGAISIFLLIVSLQLLAYHLTVDSSGRIVVRPGIHLTHALLPAVLVREVDSGLLLQDLSIQNQRDASAVAQAKFWGLASHLDVDGVRPWFKQLTPLLNKPTRIRTVVLSAGRTPTLFSDDTPPPIEETLFLSFLWKERPAAIARKLYPLQRVPDAINCEPDTQIMDFTILNVPSATFARDLWWQSLLALGDPAKAEAAILTQIANVAYRARTAKDEDPSVGLSSLAFSLAALSLSVPRSSNLQKTLVSQLDTPCRAHAALGLHFFGSQADNERAEARLLMDLDTLDRSKQGDLPNKIQAMAAQTLMVMAGTRRLSDATIDALSAALLRDDPELELASLWRTILLGVAVRQALPASLQSHLFARLETPEGLHQFGHLAAVDLLSRNIAFLTPDQTRRLGAWLSANAPQHYTMSDIHSALGFFLSADDGPREALVGLLVERLSPGTYFPVPPFGYRGELVISSGGEAAAIALGRALNHRAFSDDVIDRLVRFAMSRNDVLERHVIVNGFARRWYMDTPKASDIRTRLAASSTDARRRLLEVEVACSRLTQLSKTDRDTVLAGLVSLWQADTEPELRIAMAQVIARSQWPRYANLSFCAID